MARRQQKDGLLVGKSRRNGRSWWQSRTLQRVGLAIVGVMLVLGGTLGLIFGGCHSGGGFCAGEFQDDHAGALAMGVIGTGIGVALLAWSVSRRRAVVAVAVIVAVTVSGVVVVRSLP